MKKLLIIFSVLFIASALQAKVKLPEIIGNNMVLQQDTQVKLWGKAKANTTVHVKASWESRTFSTTAGSDGKWIILVPTPKATYKPQSIELSDGEISVINNILIGEVWFCSGQSNMEMPLNGFWNNPIQGANGIIANAAQYKGLRFVNIERAAAPTPQETAKGTWRESTPETLQWCSATAFFFAAALEKALGVPVGIINCSWGGSRVEGWLPKEILDNYPDVDVNKEVNGNEKEEYLKPVIMYNGMLKPLQNYTIKGFLWYQGESNVGHHKTYPDRLATMVDLWRTEWALGELPFYYVEIAPFAYGDKDADWGARLREAQFKAQSLIPNSGMITTNDLVEPYEFDNVHPKNKTTVGKRLCYMALANTYGFKGIADRGPAYTSMQVKDGKAYLTFNNAGDGYNRMNGIAGFEIAGDDKVFYPAKAEVGHNKEIIVSSDAVATPVAVRYAFRNVLIGNLCNTREQPVYPFRTDSWE